MGPFEAAPAGTQARCSSCIALVLCPRVRLLPQSTRRALTAEELSVLEGYCERYSRDGDAMRPDWKDVGVPGAGLALIGSLLFGLGVGVGPFILAGGLAALVASGGIAWRARSLESRVSPFAGSTQGVETWIEARRAVFTVDDRGDGQLYALLELPDGTWHLLADDMLAPTEDLISALSHGRTGWLNTDKGFPLWLRSQGELIPSRGVTAETSEAIEIAIEAGFCWSPEALEGDVFTADQLPAWVTDWSIPPQHRRDLL